MSDRDWLVQWIGLPYAPGGRGPAYDCLGLFLAVTRARRGVTLPDPAVAMIDAEAQAEWRAQMALHPRVEEAPPEAVREGDALLFRFGPDRLHIGYALDAVDMLHLPDSRTGSTIERWQGMRWGGRLIGVWRYD